MSKYVEGSYLTAEDANRAVEALLSQGYDRSAITMASNQATNAKLSTDVHTKVYGNDSSHEEDESMMDKIKDVFTGDSNNSGSDSSNLTSDSENTLLNDYRDDIQNGNVVILVDDNSNVSTNDNPANTNAPVTPPTGDPIAPNTVNQPIVDPINPGSDTVVDSNADNSVEPAPDPTDDPGIDPTDPAHNSKDTDKH
ncbi:Heat induced stress protein YflT [Marinilactibacillus piezotolerans]|uniref:Heat induced stress protein YflT n=1 Tax=Marinilactibacillus piezotolerans TaxID=258723 RepID=A0A1I4BTZ0_9LACT|nr:general stress protein [Marinilactibacillus piezotolerans]SFK71529.1 Heat induced stress protein YflT [Marinilactibacillus piezotolerans]